jgi:DNA polymerase-3 subunit delta
VNYKDIIENIRQLKIDNLYFFYGKEDYLLDNTLNMFKDILNEDMLEFNLDILDGKDITFDQIKNSVETVPFMDERKLVIIKEFECLTGKKKNFSEETQKELIDYIKNLPSYTTVIFVLHSEVDKKNKLYKEFSKSATICNFNKLSDTELFKWVIKRFEKNGVSIDNSKVSYFIHKSGYTDYMSEKNLSELKSDIDKISDYTDIGNKVSIEAIDNLTENKIENNIFNLIDSISMKNSSKAMKILNDILGEGQSVFAIFSMLAKQFKNIIQVKKLKSKKTPQSEIASILKIHIYTLKKMMKQVDKLSEKEVIEMMNFLLESEYKIKNGLLRESLSLEMFISKFCS